MYVAMHIMKEDDTGGGDGHGTGDESENGFTNGSLDHRSNSYPGTQAQQPYRKNRKSLKLVMAAMGGMLLPLITQIGHAH